jgi:hypothetical protein
MRPAAAAEIPQQISGPILLRTERSLREVRVE